MRTPRPPAHSRLLRLFLPLHLALTVPAPALAQIETTEVGVVTAGLLLRKLDGEKRVLMIGAHPDDEDTSLLATFAHGHGARTAYLSLTRGDGGQNLIGSELREGLGLIRTGELLAARSIDGALQFFTRAFDFGFSKTADETFRHWPEEELLRDVTWVVRTFRPHVILSVFTGTPVDGAGQHQAAGIVARRAFEVAGDPAIFPDQLELGVEPWSVSKIYQLNRFGRGTPSLELETGALDPLLGRSYFQVAMRSRSQHRSQDMGSAQSPGPRTSGGSLITSRFPAESEDGFFAGVDTTLAGIAAGAGALDPAALSSHVEHYRAAVVRASEQLHPMDPGDAAASLQDAAAEIRGALAALASAPAGPGRTEAIRVFEAREVGVTGALLAASGIVVDARAARPRVSPGEDVEVTVTVWNGGTRAATAGDVQLELPEGWTSAVVPGAGDSGERALAPGSLEEWRFLVHVPDSARLSRPYFLERPRDGALYRWPAEPARMGRPGNPPPLVAEVDLALEGAPPLEVRRAASHVAVDQADGEYRVPVFVMPRYSVMVEPRSFAWPEGQGSEKTVAVRVTNLSQSLGAGEVRVIPPAGWQVEPASFAPVDAGPGEEVSLAFRIRPGADAAPGLTAFRAVLEVDGREYDESVTFIDYEHIAPVPFFEPAALSVSRFSARVRPNTRVGYVMGPGDGGPEALADLGVEVELLGPNEVRAGDLDRFDTIVLGIRAYETRDDLHASNDRLLDFARRGGTVVTQYNQYQYPAGGFAPLPVEMARPHDRVTDETAEVVFLEPGHPLLVTPNPLGPEDFEGWVQERGLYFLNSWDPGYTPLLEMADPGETPKRGSLLVTRVGGGAFVYTGLALFRQFPVGVPGAFRLLANLVSLRGSDLGPSR